MGDDDLDLLHVSRHCGMTIDVTGPIACEFVQPGLTQWPRAGDLVPDLVADVPRAHGPYRALADAGRTHGAALESWTRWPTTLRGAGLAASAPRNPRSTRAVTPVASRAARTPETSSNSCSWQLPGQPPSHHSRSPWMVDSATPWAVWVRRRGHRGALGTGARGARQASAAPRWAETSMGGMTTETGPPRRRENPPMVGLHPSHASGITDTLTRSRRQGSRPPAATGDGSR